MANRFEPDQLYRTSTGLHLVIVAVTTFAVGGEMLTVIAYRTLGGTVILQRSAHLTDGWTLVVEEGSEETVALSDGSTVIVSGDSLEVSHGGVHLTRADRQALIDALNRTAPKETTER